MFFRTLMRAIRTTPLLIMSLVLAVSVGTTGMIISRSLMNVLFFDELAVPKPEQLFLISGVGRSGRQMISSSFLDGLNAQEFIQGACGFVTRQLGVGEPGQVHAAAVLGLSGKCDRTLRATPLLGRLLIPADSASGADRVVALSYNFWTKKMNSDPRVIGEAILIEGRPFRIVGVVSPPFKGLVLGFPFDVMIAAERSGDLSNMGTSSLAEDAYPCWIMVRASKSWSASVLNDYILHSWKEIRQIAADATTNVHTRGEIQQQEVQVEYGSTGIDYVLKDAYGPSIRAYYYLSLFTFFISCITYAGLLTSWYILKSNRFASQLTLGAQLSRFYTELICQCAMLVFVGTLLAVPAGLSLLLLTEHAARNTFGNLSLLLRFDRHMMTTLAGCGAAYLLTSLVTILAFFSGIRSGQLRPEQTGLNDRLRLFIRSLAMDVQLAATIAILGMTLKYMLDLEYLSHVKDGFSDSNVGIVSLAPIATQQTATIDDTRYHSELLAEILNIQNISSAALSSSPPLLGIQYPSHLYLASQSSASATADVLYATSEFITAIGSRLELGRTFLANEDGTAIVNQSLAQTLFPNKSPIDQKLMIGDQRATAKSYRIIGIAENVRLIDLHTSENPFVLLNYNASSEMQAWPTLTFRSTVDPSVVARDVLRVVAAKNREYPVWTHTLSEQKRAQLFREDMLARHSVFLAVISITLLCLGIAGITDYHIKRRRREIAICLAVGAQRRSIFTRLTSIMFLHYSVAVISGIALTGLVLRGYTSLVSIQYSTSNTKVILLDVSLTLGSLCLGMLCPFLQLVRIPMNELLRDR